MKPIRKKKTVTESLHPSVPMALNRHGIVMVFRRNLGEREIKVAFDRFHLAAAIETPGGYYLRPEHMMSPANTPASRTYQAILAAQTS